METYLYVHQLLDAAGLPFHPEPGENFRVTDTVLAASRDSDEQGHPVVRVTITMTVAEL